MDGRGTCSRSSSRGSSNEEFSVVDEYFDLFPNQRFRWSFAENAVVDWFGRQIRGANKIHEFLKYEVWLQYEHRQISDPEECGPIETRCAHFATKTLERPKRSRNLNHTGVASLKTYADSDTEHNHEDLRRVNTTPEVYIIKSPALLPSSVKKSVEIVLNDSDSEVEDSNFDYKGRLKRLPKRSFRYLRRFPRKMRKHDNDKVSRTYNEAEDDEYLSLESSDEEPSQPPIDVECYGPLKYVRVNCKLDTKQTISRATGSPIFDGHESEIRISLSYRQHLIDNTIQFALVIYEHLDKNGLIIKNSKLTRRNLFEEIAHDEDLNEEIEVVVETTVHEDSNELSKITKEISLTEVPSTRVDSVSTATVSASISSDEEDEDECSRLSAYNNLEEAFPPLTSPGSSPSSIPISTLLTNPLTASIFSPSRSSTTTSNSTQSSPGSTTTRDSSEAPHILNIDASLRTPTKTNGVPSTPKRKSKLSSKSIPTSLLKRLQESPFAIKTPPKRTAARCLRL